MLQSTPVQRRAGSARRAYDHAPRWVRLGVRVGALVGALAVLDVLFLRATRLPAARFEEPVLVAELARRLLGLDPAALVLLGFLLGLVGAGFWHRSFGPRWEAFGLGRRFRVLALVAAGALAWAAATYGYNAYFDQLHAVDRLLLVALLPLVVWRPVFVWAFLLVLFPVLWQFHVPIGGASWAEPFLLIRVLMVLGVAYLFRALTGRLRGADVVFVLCCLVAAHYWVSGVGKVELDGWVTGNRLHYLLPATYANGWLSFLPPETIGTLTRGLGALDVPLKAFTLLVECGALVALVHRRVLAFFLCGWIALHAGIFLTTGFCFWKWALLEAALLVLFVAPRRVPLPMFSRGHVLLSVVLIGGGAIWFRPVKLAWHDTRTSYTYRFDAVTAAGDRYPLPPRFFEPYSYQFTIADFGYLSEAPRLPIVGGGAWDPETVEGLRDATTPEALWRLEAEHGRVGFDAGHAARLDAFLRRFVTVRLERGTPGAWAYLQAPPLLWTFPYRPALPPGADVRRIVVTHVTALYDGAAYREVRAEPVRVVVLDAEPGATAAGRRP